MGKRIEIKLDFEDSKKSIGKYLVFDTETSGLPINKDASPEDFNNWPYVLQIAWLLFDDEHKLIEYSNFYLKQPVEISTDATNIHGITTAMMLEQGIEPSNVYDKLKKALDNTEYLIAHNIDFDIPIVHCDFLRNGLIWDFPNNRILCTMKAGTSFCKIQPQRNGEYKWPNLTELYQKCFFPGYSMNIFPDSTSTSNLHSANIDAALAAQCFFKLKDLGFFKELRIKATANKSSTEQMKSNFENLHSINKSNDWTRNEDYLYVAEIKHLGLGTYRKLKNVSEWCLHDMIDNQFKEWDKKWENISHKRKLQSDKEASLNIAHERTLEARKQQKQIDELLTNTLNIDNTVDWDSLKDFKGFSKPMPSFIKPKAPDLPTRPTLPPKPVSPPFPEEPIETDKKFQPKLSIFDSVYIARKKDKIQKCKELFEIDHDRWICECNDIMQATRLRCDKWEAEGKKKVEEFNKSVDEIKRIYETKVRAAKNAYDAELDRWVKEKDEYCHEQEIKNKSIEKRKILYFEKAPDAIVDYCYMVLSNSKYPDFFPQDYDLDYNPETKMFIVDYFMPCPNDLPTLKEVKYIATRDEFKETHITEAELNRLYDRLIYQIALRSIHELYEADTVDSLASIVFNGWVKFINKGTGNETTACIISLQVNKNEFLEINLSQIDPKECFKRLKGVGSSKLSGLTPVAPLLQMDRKDKRFVSSRSVVNKLQEGHNLAIIEWEEFEHLVREMFEKEFSSVGGEVKVTQASRDGGVDAVVFDPDPIRGGKIIIQAKRYTNTVNVSAVRDLYGTVMNEGANKGILITTADYGPDSYNFAKDKPLTLLNGSNLLFLLEKNGYKARIDLKEAKQIFSEKQ